MRLGREQAIGTVEEVTDVNDEPIQDMSQVESATANSSPESGPRESQSMQAPLA
jgi:hypothetical protein